MKDPHKIKFMNDYLPEYYALIRHVSEEGPYYLYLLEKDTMKTVRFETLDQLPSHWTEEYVQYLRSKGKEYIDSILEKKKAADSSPASRRFCIQALNSLGCRVEVIDKWDRTHIGLMEYAAETVCLIEIPGEEIRAVLDYSNMISFRLLGPVPL